MKLPFATLRVGEHPFDAFGLELVAEPAVHRMTLWRYHLAVPAVAHLQIDRIQGFCSFVELLSTGKGEVSLTSPHLEGTYQLRGCVLERVYRDPFRSRPPEIEMSVDQVGLA